MAITFRARTLLTALLACTCLLAVCPLGMPFGVLVASLARAADTLIVGERFTPDELGAPTNLSVTAQLRSDTGGSPSPVTKLTLYAPAGLAVDARFAGVCTAARLEQRGPRGCPADSRAGFGGGVAVLALPKETIRERYTLDFFFAPSEHGRLALLAYASATSPVVVELVVTAREVRAPKPYGLGFSVEVPPISTLPGAPLASIESAFATFGSANVAYYKRIRGKRTLVHLRGLLVPRSCPPGGFQSLAIIDFADGATLTVNPTIPCPHGS